MAHASSKHISAAELHIVTVREVAANVIHVVDMEERRFELPRYLIGTAPKIGDRLAITLVPEAEAMAARNMTAKEILTAMLADEE